MNLKTLFEKSLTTINARNDTPKNKSGWVSGSNGLKIGKNA